MDISQKKIYEWPIDIYKMFHVTSYQGNANLGMKRDQLHNP